MRQRLIVAFAIVASLLVVTTLPMAGAYTGDKVVVESQHSTTSDFNSATTLRNMSVDSGAVTLKSESTYSIVDDSGDGSTEVSMNPFGDSGDGNPIRSEFRFEPTTSGTLTDIQYYVESVSGSDYGATVDVYIVKEKPDQTYGEGTLVAENYDPTWETGWQSLQLDTPIDVSKNDTYTLEFVTDSSDGDSTWDNVEISMDDSFSETWSSYSDGGANGGTYSEGGQIEFTVQPSTGTYVSANHSVSDAQQAAINVTAASNVSVTGTVLEYNSGSWSELSSETWTTTGNHSISLSPSSSTLRTRLEVDKTGSNPQFELSDESILFTNHAPTVDNGSATPSGGEKMQSKTVDLSINASDQEFGTVQGENVTVTFYDASDDSVIGSETLSSNGTATTEWNNVVGGTNQWYAIAEDDYGGEVQSETFSFEAPETLYLRNETDTDQLVGDSIETTITFFGSGQVYEKTTSDGTVNLTGLPVNEDFIVDVDPSSDYHGRTIYIQSIYDQQNVYLLSTSEASVESRFVLEDPTGQYDSETLFLLEKPINQSGTVSYQTIVSDQFGSEGVTTVLDEGARYRIRIRSVSGTTQEIGPYRADVGETVTVRPGSPTIDLGELEDGWAANATINNDTIEYVYSDPDSLTDSVTVTAHEKGNTSNTLDTPREYYDLGEVSGTYALTENQTSKTWVVKFDVDRDGEQYSVTEEVSNRPDLVPDLSDAWRLVIGIGIMLISAGVFSMLNASVGGVVVALEGGILWWTGWLGGATTGAAVVIALFVAVTVHIYSSSGP